jgi:Domain of unknown function (DUF4129)
MRGRRHQHGQSAISLLETAFHLLRGAPAGAWVAYYAGSVPWVLLLLAYGAEMAGPGRYATEGAVLLALGYLGMKTGHARFARRLLEQLRGDSATDPAKGDQPKWLSTFVQQATWQPWSLFLLPLALVIGLPYGWAYAYFQSLQIVPDSAAARRQASLWPKQNHLAIFLLWLVAVFVFLNAAITILAVPSLLDSLFGIDNAAARNPFGLFSWTTFALAAAVVYLAVGPLAKAFYVLRCFQGEALRSGADLRAELAGRSAKMAAVLGVLLVAGCGPHSPAPLSLTGEGGSPPTSGAGDTSSVTPSPARPRMGVRERGLGVRSEPLDAALDETLERPEFAWRLPRADSGSAEPGFFTPLWETLSRWTRAGVAFLERLLRWLRDLNRASPDPAGSTGFGWIGSTYLWLALLAIAVLVGAVLLYRRRHAKPSGEVVAATPVALDPLATDASTAAASPPDEWLARADELLRAGDARQAVRALYLAGLSLLAHRQLLVPERSKSNRDYLAELRRRGREHPALAEVFLASSNAFERVWYGHHAATAELVTWFHDQHGQLARHAS